MKVMLWCTVATLCCGQLQAGSFEYKAFAEQALVKICSETQQDDRYGLKKTLKENRIKVQTAVDKVVCNGMPLAAFARYEQAHKVAQMLAPYEKRGKGHVDIRDISPAN
ncbi:MAG: DUF3718 domain-containing protein [Rheinheimera sp.]|nr:MAG: DUF3718 domain-containing protein [Rheinheimera sp.]